MSDPDTKPSSGRPSKVTLATTMGGVSCLVLIFSLFDTLSRLRGVDMRDQVNQTLSEPPFDTMALSTADVLAGMRVMTFVAAALAAAGVVLAIYTARRHKGARIGFTVVAALLLLTTPVSGVLTFLVGIAALLLWGEPARAWFKGHDPKTAGARRQEALMSAGDRPSEGSGSSWPYGPQGSDAGADGASSAGGSGSEPGKDVPAPQPPPYGGTYGDVAQPAEEPTSGQPSEHQSWQGQSGQQAQPWQEQGQQAQQGQQWQGQPPYGQASGQGGQGGPGSYGYPAQYGQAPYGQVQGQPYGSPYGPGPGSYGSYPSGQGGGSGKRPGTVTAAAVLTLLGAIGGLLMGLLLMAGLSIDSDTISNEVRKDPSFEQMGWDVDQVLSVIWVVAVILTLWSLSAMVLAVFVLRRQQWARWLLVASAAVSALLSLLAILSVVSILPLILSVATIVLLFAGGANAWFSGGGRDDQTPSGPQWSSSPGPW